MVPIRLATAANFPGQLHGRRRRLAPSLTKSAVRHCYNPTPGQAWQVFPLAERSFVQGVAPGSPGKLALSSCQGRSEEHTSELQSLTNLVCRLLLEKKK